jgi:D-glycero-D-manno-heptose 1,7-bisphosphate phosphatase
MQAVFLDRDGTINVEVNYLHQPELVRLERTVGPAIARLNRAGLAVVVVTNQSGIARGIYDEAAMGSVHRRISQLLEPFGAHIDAWYFCPHHPEVTGECACRKPAVGMFTDAARDLGLELGACWMVGDKLLDVEAGRVAGCRSILVTTGYGEAYQHAVAADTPVVGTLDEAASLILAPEQTIDREERPDDAS